MIKLSTYQLRALYIFSFYIYGFLIAAIGPLIPFISVYTNIPETQYSPFFSSRAFGMLTGGILLQFLQHKYLHINLHKIISFSLIFIGLTCIMFSNVFAINFQIILIFLYGAAFCALQINLVVCLLKTCPKEDYSFWLIYQTGFFGVGALTAPFLVYIFQLDTYSILGIISILQGIIYSFLPEVKAQNPKNDQNEGQIKQQIVSNYIQYALAFFMFFMIGIQCNYSGWSSSYAVVTQIATVSQATIYPSMYWIAITIVRILYNLIPGKDSQKIKATMFLLISFQILSILVNEMEYKKFALYFNCLTGGVCMSPVYALIIGLPSQFGLSITEKQMNLILTFGFAGQGVVTWICGVLMQQIDIQMFYYFNLIAQIIMGLITVFVLINLKKCQNINKNKQLQHQLLPIQTH